MFVTGGKPVKERQVSCHPDDGYKNILGKCPHWSSIFYGHPGKSRGSEAFHHPRYLTMTMHMFSLGVGLYLAHATLQRKLAKWPVKE